MNRTNRQDQIPGWDGKALDTETVAIIGSGPLAEFVISYCAGLGTKNLTLVDNQVGGGLFLTTDTFSRVHSLEKRILDPVHGLNPDINVTAYHALPMDILFKDCSVIVDLTNKLHIKDSSYNIAKDLSSCRTYISASTDMYNADVLVKNTYSHYQLSLEDIIKKSRRLTAKERILKQVVPKIVQENPLLSYDGSDQGTVTSSIAASIVTEEIRRTLVPLENLGDRYVVADRKFSYNLQSKNHFDSDIPINLNSMKDKNVLVVGAGGTGTYASLNLALLGVKSLAVADPDSVTLSNLNRQMLYSLSDIGHNKARSIALTLKKINPLVKISYHSKLLHSNSKVDFNKFDCIYLCVDNAQARRDISNLCVERNIPVVNAGVSPFRANVEMYVPGNTSCLNCQNGNYSDGVTSVQTTSCADVGDPSIVVTNSLAGSLMVAESLPILCGLDVKHTRQFYYSSFRHDDYIKIVEPRVHINNTCGCRRAKNEAA